MNVEILTAVGVSEVIVKDMLVLSKEENVWLGPEVQGDHIVPR